MQAPGVVGYAQFISWPDGIKKPEKPQPGFSFIQLSLC